MWLIFAFGSAFFSGLTSILAKCGIEKTDSTVATAIRTIIVFFFSWLIAFLVGSQSTITDLSFKTWIFLILSGMATGASWICYFKALQIGDVNKVVPIDKSSTILSMILAFIFLHETFTYINGIAIILIAIGTYLMITKGKNIVLKNTQNKSWFIYAVLSAVFASLTSILGKIGIEGVESNLGTAIRTSVVLIMAWLIVIATKKQSKVYSISKRELLFISLSGVVTGGAWLCYYKALQDGLASVVVPIDKLSILVTIVFSYIVFKEKISKKSGFGLVLILLGTLLMVIPTL